MTSTMIGVTLSISRPLNKIKQVPIETDGIIYKQSNKIPIAITNEFQPQPLQLSGVRRIRRLVSSDSPSCLQKLMGCVFKKKDTTNFSPAASYARRSADEIYKASYECQGYNQRQHHKSEASGAGRWRSQMDSTLSGYEEERMISGGRYA